MRPGPKAPVDKVVRAPRVVVGNDLAAEAEPEEEVAERSLAAVVELGAGQEVAREAEANSAAAEEAVFFASK
jgi:hypothetical protein